MTPAPVTLPASSDSSSATSTNLAPSRIPIAHKEALGPVSDVSPESWRYQPESIITYYRQRPWLVLGRLLQVFLPTGKYLLQLWWDKLTGQSQRNEPKRAVQLRELLTQLGPTYIKVGQSLSTRPDLLPQIFLSELARLQDQLPSFPNAIAYGFIEEELGAPPQEIYAELTDQPIAAASLGQVYKGKLKSGETVAVKVQRPDLIRRITLDIYIMRSLAHWAQNNIERIRSDLVGITDELASRIFEEMNYVQEGKNAERFAQLYNYLPEIYVPKIYWSYTGRRVLTMEWIDGTKLTQIDKIQAQGIDATHLVEVGVECSLRQLLEHGFFHADPHPGNLLAMADGRLAYLDFGMMSTIKPHQRYGLIEAVVHLVNRDFEALAHDYIQLEFLTPDTDLTPIIPALSQVFGDALGASVAELNFKSLTDQMSAMMYEFPFRVPAYYALIIRSMVTLEGIAINIDPSFKVLSKAYPYIAKRLLTDPSEELRSSLRDLLFKEGRFRWNRLENLMRNASSSQDYDFDQVLDQALDFLYSERGELIREGLVNEIVNTVDRMGQKAIAHASQLLQQRLGVPVALPFAPSVENANEAVEWERLQNIWEILQDTPGFTPLELLPLVPTLLGKPETQKLGQRVAEGLAQKAAVRLIKLFLLEEQPATVLPVNGSTAANGAITPYPKPARVTAPQLPEAKVTTTHTVT